MFFNSLKIKKYKISAKLMTDPPKHKLKIPPIDAETTRKVKKKNIRKIEE